MKYVQLRRPLNKHVMLNISCTQKKLRMAPMRGTEREDEEQEEREREGEEGAQGNWIGWKRRMMRKDEEAGESRNITNASRRSNGALADNCTREARFKTSTCVLLNPDL